MELVFQFSNLTIVRGPLQIVAVCLFHDLASDELRVTSNLESADAELERDAQAAYQGFVLGSVVGRGEVESD